MQADNAPTGSIKSLLVEEPKHEEPEVNEDINNATLSGDMR